MRAIPYAGLKPRSKDQETADKQAQRCGKLYVALNEKGGNMSNCTWCRIVSFDDLGVVDTLRGNG